MAARERPQREKLEGQQQQHRQNEDAKSRSRRQSLDADGDLRLESLERDARDDPGHDRRKMPPQPCLKQKDERKRNKEEAEQAAHGDQLWRFKMIRRQRAREKLSIAVPHRQYLADGPSFAGKIPVVFLQGRVDGRGAS